MSYELLIRLGDTEEVIAVENLADAPKVLQAYQGNNDIRASDWCSAEVYKNKQLVKRFAYNGVEIE